MKMITKRTMYNILLLLFYFMPFSVYSNQIMYYQPTPVTLSGSIITLTFPGPPNYESIKQGDKPEKGAYLILSSPIDIQLLKGQTNNNVIDEPQKNVKLLQLIVLNHRDWESL